MARQKYRMQSFTCPDTGQVFETVALVKDDWTPDEIRAMCPPATKPALFTQDWPRDENGNPIIQPKEVAALGTFGMQGAKNSDNYQRMNERLAKLTASTPGAQKFEPKY